MSDQEAEDQSSPHRFRLRDRDKIRIQRYQPIGKTHIGFKTKPASSSDSQTSEYSESDSSSNSTESDITINAFELENLSGLEAIPTVLPRAKTKAEVCPRRRPQKRVKVTTEVLVRGILEDLLNSLWPAQSVYEKPHYFINCDLRFYDLTKVTEKFGLFDVVVIDPPWQDSPTSPGMTAKQVMDLQVETLSSKGFIFLWVNESFKNMGLACLSRWGYEFIDHLVWVKTLMGGKKVVLTDPGVFYHSTQSCIVGYKCPAAEKVEYRSKVSNELMIADLKDKAEKPDQLYAIIDLMMPGSKRIELFARNHSLKEGWLLLGNQLGRLYDRGKLTFSCKDCLKPIITGETFGKVKNVPNSYVCEACRRDNSTDYYLLTAQEDEAFHQFYTCTMCQDEPIYGPRFHCEVCEHTEVCIACFDTILAESKPCASHSFQVFSIPPVEYGISVHYGKKCGFCKQIPIIGNCFTCSDCPSLHFCTLYVGQNCFFFSTLQTFGTIPGHDLKHKLELVTISSNSVHGTWYPLRSKSCGKHLRGRRFKCEQCFKYDICEACYIRRAQLICRGTHKHTHTFVML